jgi:hypothetical protein
MATGATLFPLVVILYRMDYKKRIEKYFFFYLVAKLLIESIMLYMASKNQNNLYLYNALILVSYCILARMCYEAIDIPFHKKIIAVGSAIFVVVYTLDVLNVGMMYVLKFSPTLQCLLMIVYIMLFFYGLLQSLKVHNLFTFPQFWIFSGLLLFYCSSTFVTPLYYYVEQLGASRDMYILVLLPYIMETLTLTMVGFGFLNER